MDQSDADSTFFPNAMTSLSMSGPRHLRVVLPPRLRAEISGFFQLLPADSSRPLVDIEVRERPGQNYAIAMDGQVNHLRLSKGGVLSTLVSLLSKPAIDPNDSLLRAAAVEWKGRAILVLGEETLVKDLVAWLVAKEFSLASPHPVLLGAKQDTVCSYAAPLEISVRAANELAYEPRLRDQPSLRTGEKIYIQPADDWKVSDAEIEIGLILSVQRSQGDSVTLGRNSPELAIRELCSSQINTLTPDIIQGLCALALHTPCLALRYDRLHGLNGVTDRVLQDVLEQGISGEKLDRLLEIVGAAPSDSTTPGITAGRRFTLTIGMATYDDYDGVYFSVQAIRMYHPEILEDIEFVVIDNHPAGPCANALKALAQQVPNCRYIAFTERVGTAVRDRLFQEAAGEFVLCMDCHVLFAPGSLRRMLDFFRWNPTVSDLVQGPIQWDNLCDISSHWKPEWKDGMYGTWQNDARADNPDNAPFEIPLQGLGVFACRRDAWPGFNSAFRGFGGEEGYLHDKFRQRGDTVLCLPFLRWLHRFGRPLGVPYPINWEDRIRNYLFGRHELGMPADDVIAHMSEYLGSEYVDSVIERMRVEGAWPVVAE